LAHFRCYFLGQDGHFVDVEELEAATDAEAIDAARLSAKKRTGISGFSLWQQKRKIHVEAWETMSGAQAPA